MRVGPVHSEIVGQLKKAKRSHKNKHIKANGVFTMHMDLVLKSLRSLKLKGKCKIILMGVTYRSQSSYKESIEPIGY